MDESNLSEHDPYRGMETAQDEVRPDFLGGKSGGDDRGGSNGHKSAAQESLGDAEENASQHWTDDGKYIDLGNGRFLEPDEEERAKLRKGEEEAKGLYKGKGEGDGKKNKKKGKKSRFSNIKKMGPMLGVVGVIFGVGGFLGGIQSMMPFAIEELVIEKLNSISVSSTITSDKWLDEQLNNSEVLHYRPEDCEKTSFGLSEHQIEQFKQHGIYTLQPEVNTSEGPSKINVLLYLKNDIYVPVLGSKYFDDPNVNNDNLVASLKEKSGVDNLGTPISVDMALHDKTFKIVYTTASKTWRGGSSGWFDSIMKDITEIKLNVTRNRWAKYTKQSVKSADGFVNDLFERIASTKGADGDRDTVKDAGTEGVNSETGTEVDKNEMDQLAVADGEKAGQTESIGDSEIPESGVNRGQLKAILNSKAIKGVKTATSITNTACSIASGMMKIYLIVSAYQNLQFLSLISGFLEAVSKVKVGEVDSSPMNEYSTRLTTGHPTKASRPNEEEEEEYIVPGKESTSAMSSMGMAWLFGATDASSNDASVRNVNFESIMKHISWFTKDINMVSEVLMQCGLVKLVSGIFDTALDVVTLVATFGVGTIVKEIVKIAISAAISMVIQAAIGALVNYAIRQIADVIIKDVATDWLGEDLGNALVSGANKYLGGNATSGGQSPGDLEKSNAYYMKQSEVIAEEAEYQRSIRSPFDMTSKYTFLGSLAYAAIPIAYSGTGVMSMLRQVSTMTNSAVIKLLPTASAISFNQDFAGDDNCQMLNSVGATGDLFCNAYIITDTSTLGLSYDDVSAIVHGERSTSDFIASSDVPATVLEDNFEDCKIKNGSTLSKYITYCGQRTSQYGVFDATIIEQGEDGKVASVIGQTNVPILSGIADVISGVKENENVPWANGQNCVATASASQRWESEMKYIQRYTENERQLKNINHDYKSPVDAYIEESLEKNPIDTTLEGTLARFSGLSKADVEDTLDLMAYYMYLSEYDPSERLAFGAPAVEMEPVLDYDSENVLAGDVILPERILYADIRNRTFVV